MSTTTEVISLLAKRYPTAEYAVAFEVANATGAARARAADCVAMACWPSRGLRIIGHEIKVSRSDWQKELADPSKAEAIAKYCDEWFVVAGDSKIVREGELPASWGLLVASGGKLVLAEKPKVALKPIPLDRLFAAAFLRAMQKPQASAFDKLIQEARWKGHQEGREQAKRNGQDFEGKLDELTERVRKFTEETGINPLDNYAPWKGKTVGEAVRILQGGIPDLSDKIDAFRRLAKECERAASECETITEAAAELAKEQTNV